MKRATLFVFAVMILAVGIVGPALSQDAQVVQAAPAPAAGVQAAEVEALAETPACEGSVVPIPVLELGAAWHCPYNAPHCFNDDHCDAYCGDPRFGYCFSNGCCGCSG